ncbi:PAAR domain-containing protein [Burkholderia ubonensis]|uniref:PAAR domain-containing protein n=1 Tax=Burkholderia ubonensis TaxID=101571 RepID=UPI0007C6CB8C
MRRFYIRDGDKTTAGGTVVGSEGTMSIFDKIGACEGDGVICPACQSTGVIKCAGTRISHMAPSGRTLALDGDLCICKCVPPPRLIASQTMMSTEGEAEPAHSFAAATAPTMPMATASAGGTGGAPAGASSLLADAAPFELGDAAEGATTGADPETVASRASQYEEQKCFEQYERDLELCAALGGPMGGARGIALCKQRAFDRYQTCRGY